MSRPIILNNARIVFRDEVAPGHLIIQDKRIVVAAPGLVDAAEAIDLQGDLLAPAPVSGSHEAWSDGSPMTRHLWSLHTHLLRGAWSLHSEVGMSLPRAFECINALPARSLGICDRGRIAAGQRADLMRVRLSVVGPLVRELWRSGRLWQRSPAALAAAAAASDVAPVRHTSRPQAATPKRSNRDAGAIFP